MNKQKGFAHTFLILGLVLIIGATLSIVFLRSFAKQQGVGSSSKTSANNDVKSEPVKYVTYTSFSGSGLTFDYPNTWSFDAPTKESFSREGMKGTIFSLASQKLSVINGKQEIADENMCVTFFEMQGSWPFNSKAPDNTDVIDDFMIGPSKVSLVESKANLASGVSPGMQLLNQDPSSKHGAAYVALNNDYFLLATASKNCATNGHPEARDITTDLEQTKAILRSVRIAN